MASIIKKISALRSVGVLADCTSRAGGPSFLRNNLIYGFNGSGKSTLSRLFASLQAGARDERLPAGCEFEFELDDGTRFKAPDDLRGLERRVLVFNTDFVERNLQWATGTANPVFYIGRKQAKAAEELARHEIELATAKLEHSAADAALRGSERTLATFRRERARLISTEAHLRARSYEAPHLERDFDTLPIDDDAKLSEAALEAARTTCRLDDPMPKFSNGVALPLFGMDMLAGVRELAQQTTGFAVLEELERHPDMVMWVKQGTDYHNKQRLDTCLFCGSIVTEERRRQLAKAFDDRLDRFLLRIKKAQDEIGLAVSVLSQTPLACPPPDSLLTEFRLAYNEARHSLLEAVEALKEDVVAHGSVINEKKEKPTQAVDVSCLPDIAAVAARLNSLIVATKVLNETLSAHNTQVDNFRDYQEGARVSIRRHYLAIVRDEYARYVAAQDQAKADSNSTAAKVEEIAEAIVRIRSDLREHGAAAEKINKLIESYLGHRELTISSVGEGYEIHRNGRLLRGPPSEGEKTAIALCYFLSTLDADGRTLKDLILVIDDPNSSLDTKGLNYACALLKASIADAAQVFLLTHNLPCMNEFKKLWKGAARPSDPDKPPTAKLLFLDVVHPKGIGTRSSRIVEMSKLLREYDFEYHYLFHHLMQFQSIGDDYDYGYMMPNVLRRVLDVFLAFKCPGTTPLPGKIAQLCKQYPSLDRTSLLAVERLVQTESHSDSLDDLIGFSSMTVEESRRAAGAILDMMHLVDRMHTDRLMSICRDA